MTRLTSLLALGSLTLAAVATILFIAAATVTSGNTRISPVERDRLQAIQFAGAITGAVSAICAAAALVAGLAHRRRLREFAHALRADGLGEVDRRGLEEVVAAAESMSRRLRGSLDAEAAERARLGSVLAAMADGILVVDANGRVQLANEAAIESLGATVADAMGRRLIELTRSKDVNELASAAATQQKTGMREVEVMPGRRFLNVVAVPLAGGSTTPQAGSSTEGRALLVIKDVTELHRVEVTRREFVSNASHELRTPVAAIKASAETLQVAADDPQVVREFADRIVDDANRMDRMLGELLELSRLESGHTPLHMAPVDLAAFARDVASRFRPIADARRVDLTWVAGSPLPPVTADVDKLHQLAGNLVTNAIKATAEGGVVRVSVERAAGGVELRVTDTGKGIEPQHLPHIFERFYKADRTSGDSGAGLGLAIAKHIAQAHGGRIDVRSRPGEGSTFTVWLPVPVGFDQAG